ncbi:hypothetical protein Salat_2539000 [Sesamum alatum]|uniref:Uncharacterized protein n=1 Tax=Sesamum alatum TaxID=300844 RepID=A0AAE1XS88_9LAMI|nr:hypothetical protein Salat_2539000 [Sesamum alatum]
MGIPNPPWVETSPSETKDPCGEHSREEAGSSTSYSPDAIQQQLKNSIGSILPRSSSGLSRFSSTRGALVCLSRLPPCKVNILGGCCPVANSKGLKFDAELFGC